MIKKRTNTVLIIVFILLIGIVAIFYVRSSKSNVQNETASVSENSMPVPLIANITALEKEVTLKELVSGVTTKVTGFATTSIGSEVSTNGTGRAYLEDGAGKTVLDYNTSIKVQGLETHESIFLTAGNIWARVKKVASQGEFFEIETQNTVAVVRGTYFGVSYSGTTSTLYVTESTVSFFARDPVTGIRDLSSEIRVTAGEKAYRIGTGKIVHEKITDRDSVSTWFLHNNPSPPYAAPTGKTSTQTLPAQSLTTPTAINPSATTVGVPAPYVLELTTVSPSVIQLGSTEKIRVNGTAMKHLDALFFGPTLMKVTPATDDHVYVNASALQTGTYDLQAVDDKNKTTLLRQSFTVAEPIQSTRVQTQQSLSKP